MARSAIPFLLVLLFSSGFVAMLVGGCREYYEKIRISVAVGDIFERLEESAGSLIHDRASRSMF